MSSNIVVASDDDETLNVDIFVEAGNVGGEKVSKGGAVVDISNGIGALAARLAPKEPW